MAPVPGRPREHARPWPPDEPVPDHRPPLHPQAAPVPARSGHRGDPAHPRRRPGPPSPEPPNCASGQSRPIGLLSTKLKFGRQERTSLARCKGPRRMGASEWVAGWARIKPDKPAIVLEGTPRSWRDLDVRASWIGDALTSAGVMPG